MQELISDLLDYSRLSRKEISMSKIDLDKIVDTVLKNLQPELEAKEADIDIQKPLGTVKSNSTLLRQILINLLTNAVKFTKPGKKPQIKVDSKFRGKYIRLSIEDNGIGIKEEYQDKIFNIFERLHSSEDYAGNGIGLALVKKAARKLGGDCGVISDGKTGSTLWIDILNY
jgi:signal transduction histidine kinase